MSQTIYLTLEIAAGETIRVRPLGTQGSILRQTICFEVGRLNEEVFETRLCAMLQFSMAAEAERFVEALAAYAPPAPPAVSLEAPEAANDDDLP